MSDLPQDREGFVPQARFYHSSAADGNGLWCPARLGLVEIKKWKPDLFAV
jgi:hypothetical protein